MELTSMPIIVIICYLIGEIYKILFKNKDELFKFIPIFVSLIGGIIGVIMFFLNPEIINVSNFWVAFVEGTISGASATGTNQIIKQLFFKEEEKNDRV